MPRSAPRLLSSLLTLLLLTAGCSVEMGAGAAGPFDDVEQVEELPEPTDDPTVEPPDAALDLEAPLEIVQGSDGSTLAFVVVTIGEEGPYMFALDTGASNSVIDTAVAEELGLEVVSEAEGVTGVTGSTEAVRVQVTDWRTGDVDLGARPIIALDLGDPGSQDLHGLLGSDVLSQFGVITVDYTAGVLRLRPSTD